MAVECSVIIWNPYIVCKRFSVQLNRIRNLNLIRGYFWKISTRENTAVSGQPGQYKKMRVLKILLLKIYSSATRFELDSLNTLTMIFDNVLLCKPKKWSYARFSQNACYSFAYYTRFWGKKALHCNDLE